VSGCHGVISTADSRSSSTEAFFYQKTRGLYSHTSQPLLEPIAFLKLVGRLKSLFYDRRLGEHYALQLDTLLFLGYKLDGELVALDHKPHPPAIYGCRLRAPDVPPYWRDPATATRQATGQRLRAPWPDAIR
jgi:hypothetical protein